MPKNPLAIRVHVGSACEMRDPFVIHLTEWGGGGTNMISHQYTLWCNLRFLEIQDVVYRREECVQIEIWKSAKGITNLERKHDIF